MNSKLTKIFLGFLVIFIFLSNASNPPNNYTGSPQSGNNNRTCANCHSAGNFSGSVAITGLPATINPNATYNITVTTSYPIGGSVPIRAGFQLDAIDSGDNFIGTLSNPGPSSTVVSGGTLFEHFPAQNFGGNTSVSWTADWTAPAGPAGETVTMYSASVLGNGGSSFGDQVVTTTTMGTIAGGGGGNVSVAINASSDVSCFGGNDGSATALASGGSGNYTYSWSSGANTATANNLTAGTYTVTATDTSDGMTGSASVTINQPNSVVQVSIINSTNINCTNPVGTASANATGGVPTYTYMWSNGSNGASTVLPAGTHTVTATDNNGCTAITMVTITEDTTTPNATAGPDMQIDCNNNSVVLNGSGDIGAHISIQWTTPNGTILSGGNTYTPTVTEGDYTITVTNNNNTCQTTDNLTVTSNTNAPVAVATAGTINCVNTTATIDGTGSSTGNVSYMWNGPNILSGQNSIIATTDTPGDYTFTVTNNDNGCSTSINITVAEDNTPPTVTINISGELNCNSNSVTLTANSSAANSSFEWSGPDNFFSNVFNPMVTFAGTYTVIVTDEDNGCTETVSVIVNETPDPTVAIISQTNVDCNGLNTGSLTAEGNGGTGILTYAWSSGGNMPTENNLSAGMYIVTVTDEIGCTAIETAIITEPDVLIANASATGETGVNSMDGTATAVPTGGTPDYSYNWSNGGMTQTISNLVPANYTITVTDSNGCTTEESVTVSSFDCSNISLEFIVSDVTCNGGSNGLVTVNVINGAPPIEFQWSNGAMTQTVSNLAAGTYNVLVTDGNNCQILESVTVGQPDEIIGMVNQVTPVTCNGGNDGSATVSAMGGTGNLTYQWNDPMAQTSTTATNLPAGVYTVLITDENFCSTMLMVTITEPAAIQLSVTTTDETGNMTQDGTATANAMGGTPDFSYLWNTGDNLQMINNLPPGEYCVTVTDANGCTTEACGMINMFSCPVSNTVINTDPVSCFGGTDGFAALSSFGGAEPYSYVWNNGQTGSELDNLSAGDYSITCTDASNCSSIVTLTITEPIELIAHLNIKTDVFCEGENDGFISVGATGGILGYEFLWNTGATTPLIENLAPGVYTCTITDANDCEATISEEILLLPDTQVPIVTTNHLTVYLDENGSASISAEEVDGGSFDNCEISAIEVTPSDFNCDMIGSNIALLTVLDVSGNCDFDTSFINVVDTIPPELICPDNIVEMGCNLAIEYDMPTATDNCGVNTPFLFEGFPSGGIFPSGITTVSWGVSDVNNNAVTCSFTVTLDSEIETMTSFTEPACTGFEDGTATVEVAGGMEPYQFLWNDENMQNTQTATGLQAGEYLVTATDATGCSVISNVEITEPAPIEIDFTTVTDETNNDMNGAVDITVSGGSGQGFMYQWFLDGNLISEMEDISGLSTGNYVVMVTDDTDCAVADTVFVDMIVATDNFDLEKSISLSPNPTTGQFNLNFNLPTAAEVSITTFDFTGKEIMSSPKQNIENQILPMNFSDFSEGVYLLRIAVNEEVLLRKVLIQQ